MKTSCCLFLVHDSCLVDVISDSDSVNESPDGYHYNCTLHLENSQVTPKFRGMLFQQHTQLRRKYHMSTKSKRIIQEKQKKETLTGTSAEILHQERRQNPQITHDQELHNQEWKDRLDYLPRLFTQVRNNMMTLHFILRFKSTENIQVLSYFTLFPGTRLFCV